MFGSITSCQKQVIFLQKNEDLDNKKLQFKF